MRPMKFIDLNALLRAANLVTAGAIGYAAAYVDNHPYLDSDSIWLGLALCLQTELALYVERRHRDPFAILLATWMILFFQLRVFTLALLPFSAVLDRFSYEPADTNNALLFIFAGNLFLYLGFHVARFRADNAISAEGWRGTAPLRVVAVLVMTLALTYLSGKFWSEGAVPRGINFLVLYLSPTLLVLMALLYYVVFKRKLGRWFAVIIGLLIAGELVAHTLLGSRGAVVGFLQTVLVVILAVHGCVRIRRGFVVAGLLLLPFIVVALIGAFMVSSYIRVARVTEGANLSVGLQRAGEAGTAMGERAIDAVLASVASRIGYLDFSADVMAHREEFASVINLPTYGKSLIDNLLTPGVDFFDQPKISNSLMFIYRDLGPPTRSIPEDEYQSDQLGIHGEFYALAGWGALPFFFLVAFLFKRCFDSLKFANPFVLAMQRVVVLYVFMRLIESFGMDWVIIDALPVATAVVIYAYFFSARRERVPDSASAAT
jgi:hypothetical protein